MTIGTRQVPNEGPKDARIYIVGEAPGADEVIDGRPFVGVSGQLLRNCLGRCGVSEATIRFANLCQYQPEGNKFASVLGSRQLAAGIEELASDIREFRPTVIAALGNWPLYTLTGRRGKKGAGSGIGKWRGSILPCSLDGCGDIKVIATFHPAFIVRNREAYPIFDTDIKRVIGDSAFREFRYPERKLVLDPRGSELDYWVDYLRDSEWLDCDIETIKKSHHILCHGFSPEPGISVVIPEGVSDFTRRSAIDAIYRSRAKKCFHNGAGFDLIQLSVNGYTVDGYEWDTMTAQHVMWAELPKSLEYLTSVYTRQVYYKTAGRAEIPADGKSWDTKKFDPRGLWEYNGTDTSCTSAIRNAQMDEMTEGPALWMKKFRDKMREAWPAIRISLAGVQIDLKRRATIKKSLEMKWAINQFILDRLTGYHTNVNSPKVIKAILFDKDKLSLPPRKNRNGDLTTDEDAIVSLLGYCKDYMSKLKPGGSAIDYWRTRLEALKLILLIRGIRKLLSNYVNNPISDDGRWRATFKITGAETLRWSCSSFVDGTGGNAQTFPREVLELKAFEEIPQLAKLIELIKQQEAEDDDDRESSGEESDSGSVGLLLSEL